MAWRDGAEVEAAVGRRNDRDVLSVMTADGDGVGMTGQ